MSGDMMGGDMMKTLIGAVVPTVLGAMLNKTDKPDEPKAPPVAPSSNDKQRRIAKEREMQRKYAYSGRAGTVLGSSTLG